MKLQFFLFVFMIGIGVACAQQTNKVKTNMDKQISNHNNLEIATFGGGCFWCVEAVYQELIGVEKVVSGYSGGQLKNPSYKDIGTGRTGHAEVTQIHFDPELISFETLLDVFWSTHDPTTVNRQGNDVGPQYRSIILYHDNKQKEVANKSRKEVAPKLWQQPVVTEIKAFEVFYKAEEYHQDFYSNNPKYGYCRVIIDPKVRKFREKFADKLKPIE